MASENETVADILKDMRNGLVIPVHENSFRDILRMFADRLEAAVKREVSVAEHATTLSGDAANLRKALKELRDSARAFTHEIRNSKYSHILDKYTCSLHGFPSVLDLRETIPNANFALAAPPRNCDVGTAEEQAERFFAFCDSNKCPSCPCRFTKKTDCALIWAQKPYEAKEGGAE